MSFSKAKYNLFGQKNSSTQDVLSFANQLNKISKTINDYEVSKENGFVTEPQICVVGDNEVVGVVKHLEYRAYGSCFYTGGKLRNGFAKYKDAVEISEVQWNTRTVKLYTMYELFVFRKGVVIPVTQCGYSLSVMKCPYLDAVETDVDYRGKGLATYLVGMVLKDLRDDGHKEVYLDSVNETPAKRLYAHFGFKERELGDPLISAYLTRMSKDLKQLDFVPVIKYPTTMFTKAKSRPHLNRLLFAEKYPIEDVQRFIKQLHNKIEMYKQADVNTKFGFTPYCKLARGKNGAIFGIFVTNRVKKYKEVVDGHMDGEYLDDPYNYAKCVAEKKKDEQIDVVTEFQAYIYECKSIKKVGTITAQSISSDNTIAYIDDNFVKFDYQCQGITSAMADELLQFLADRGYKQYKVDCSIFDPMNTSKGSTTPAMSVWLHRGAHIDTTRPVTTFTCPLIGDIAHDRYINTNFPIQMIEKE